MAQAPFQDWEWGKDGQWGVHGPPSQYAQQDAVVQHQPLPASYDPMDPMQHVLQTYLRQFESQHGYHPSPHVRHDDDGTAVDPVSGQAMWRGFPVDNYTPGYFQSLNTFQAPQAHYALQQWLDRLRHTPMGRQVREAAQAAQQAPQQLHQQAQQAWHGAQQAAQSLDQGIAQGARSLYSQGQDLYQQYQQLPVKEGLTGRAIFQRYATGGHDPLADIAQWMKKAFDTDRATTEQLQHQDHYNYTHTGPPALDGTNNPLRQLARMMAGNTGDVISSRY